MFSEICQILEKNFMNPKKHCNVSPHRTSIVNGLCDIA